LPRLIALLAEQADVQPAEARKFLHELFANVEAALINGESVVIKGVGEFIKSEDPALPVLFKADNDLAAFANEPFAAFEAVELNEGAADEILKAVSAQKVAPAPSEPENVSAPVYETVDADVDKEEIEDDGSGNTESLKSKMDIDEPAGDSEEEVRHEATPDVNDKPVEDPKPTVTPETTDNAWHDTNEQIVYVKQPASHGMWLMLGVLIGLIAGLIGGYFAGKYMAQYELPAEEDMVFDEDTITVASIFDNPIDTVIKAETVSADVEKSPVPDMPVAEPKKTESTNSEPVYDTVSSKRYLAIIAGEHYGVKNYWIFIYNANPDLGDPNKIAPGTKVIVPAKESFMEDTKAATDAKSRRLLNELSKRYKL
ncbi:MAG: HU family DNA-binding protein, partial [Muribaculaceae bacterium]|nr:HU family DNA-binding protein [Muribaculaceae bacterium]